MLPVTAYAWEDLGWFSHGKPYDRMKNKLTHADDPFNIEMYLTYGPMTLYDTDQMI